MSRLALAWLGVAALLVVGLLPLVGDVPIPTSVGFACLLVGVVALPALALVSVAVSLSSRGRANSSPARDRGSDSRQRS